MAKKPKAAKADTQEPTPMPNDAHVTPTETLPAISLTIQGLIFSVDRVYPAGHVLTEDEASALDQMRRENLRNNFASRIAAKLTELKKSLPEGSPDPKVSDLDETELRSEFQSYVDEYSFSARKTRTPLDPVLAEATRMAKAQITTALRSKSIDLKTVTPEKMAAYVEAFLAKYPQVTEEARRRVAISKEISADVLDSLE